MLTHPRFWTRSCWLELLARRHVPLAQNHPGRSRAAGNSASKRRVAALRASSPHC